MAEKLGEEGSQAARRLRERITLGIPRFEASEDVSHSVITREKVEANTATETQTT